MIKFLRFIAHNLLWYDEVDVSLNNQGLVYIGGKNGVGKSLLFDAIQDAIFKTTPRGLSKGDVAGKDAFYTCLRVRVNESKYDIEYFRNHEKHKNGYRITKDGEPDTPHGIPACERHIKAIFGLSPHEWSTIYYSQRSLSTLVEGTNAERQAYLDRLFNIVQYDEIITRIKDELKVLKFRTEEVASLNVLVEDAKQELATMPLLTDLEEQRKNDRIKLTKATEYSDKTSDEIKKYEKMLADNQRRLTLLSDLKKLPLVPNSTILRGDLKEVRAKLVSYVEKRTLAAKRTKYQIQLDDLVKPKRTVTKIKSELEKIVVEREELQNLLKSIAKREKVVVELNKLVKPNILYDDAVNAKHLAVTELGASKAKVRLLQDQLIKLDPLDGAECPTCGHPIDQKNIAKHREEIENEIDDLRVGIKENQIILDAMHDATNKHNDIMDKLTALNQYPNAAIKENETIDSLNACDALIKKLKIELGSTEEWNNLQEKISEIDVKETADAIDISISKLDVTATDLGNKIETAVERETLTKQIAELKEIDEETTLENLASSARAYEVSKSDCDKIRDIISVTTSKITEVEKVTEKVERLETQLEKHKATQNKIYLLDNVHAAFKKLKQLRRHLVLQTLIQHLQQYAALFFDKDSGITFGLHEDDDSVAFLCTQKDCPPYDIRTMSGGEKSRVTLSLLFTLPKLIAPRKRANMLILDEVDSALDAEGKEMLTTSVFPSLRSMFSSIFVISHNNDFNLNTFEQIWQIVKQDGVSSIIKSERMT